MDSPEPINSPERTSSPERMNSPEPIHSIDQQVFQQVSRWLEAGETCWLCTVLATFGAAPRPIGSLLACTQTELVGSLSGGCVEDDRSDEHTSELQSRE